MHETETEMPAHRNSTDNYTLGRDSPAKKLNPGGLIPYEIAVCSRGNPLTVGVQIRNVSIKGQGAPGGPLVGGDILGAERQG